MTRRATPEQTKRNWTAAEDALLRRRMDAAVTAREIADELGRSEASVTNRCTVLGASRNRNLDAVFASRYCPEPNSGCWLWLGSTDRKGYGQIRVTGNTLRYATHVSLELVGRPRPGKLFACHKCDNPSCVNPDHLFWGTAKANSQDAKRKGRLVFSGLDAGRKYMLGKTKPFAVNICYGGPNRPCYRVVVKRHGKQVRSYRISDQAAAHAMRDQLIQAETLAS